MNKGLKLYIADIVDDADRMLALSLVKKPASGMKWKVIANDGNIARVIAPIIPANVPIYRKDEMGEYNVLFTPETISDLMLDASKRRVPFDCNHSGLPIRNVEIVESWQTNESVGIGSGAYGSPVPDGTWMMHLSIKKLGFFEKSDLGWLENFSGISISGRFSYDEVSLHDAIDLYNMLNVQK